MDFEENPELIFGEEFCFPATATYYPTPYAPDELNLPADLYEHQPLWGCGDQDLHYSGQQAEGTPFPYYVFPGYGIAHSPLGPYPSEPRGIADGRFPGGQEYLANTADITYHQPVPTPRYDVLPSAPQWGLASTSRTLTYTDNLFIPSGQGQSFPVAWNPSLQSTGVSPKKVEDRAMLSKAQLHSSDPWKQDLAARTMVPAKLRRAPHASRHSLHVGFPSVKSSQQANSSYSYNASNVGSDLRKMVIAEKLQPSSKHRSYVKGFTGKLSSPHSQKIGQEKKPRSSMPSEIVVKSYTSMLHIGNPQGEIIIRTDQYNRDDFQLMYPNAKFFVIKSYSEANVHKSIKYGVWSSSILGNQRLDSAFKDAQMIAASSSTSSSCPVFLFFSIHYCPGTCMLKIFKSVPKMYSAHAYVPRQPKADRALVDRIIRETHNLAGKPQHENLDMRQESGNLVLDSAKTSAQRKKRISYGKQAHENDVKSNVPAALDGRKLTWQEAEIAPVETEHPQTAANASSEAPEEYPAEVKNALVHSASAIPETIYEEKKIIAEHCSPAISSQMNGTCSSCSIDDVIRIGSMLVPMKISN